MSETPVPVWHTVRSVIPAETMRQHGLDVLRWERDRARHMLGAKGPVYLSRLRHDPFFDGFVGLWEER